MNTETTSQPLARGLALTLLAIGATGVANAGFVTTNESGLDAVYGQAAFGANKIDIRFLPALTIYNTTFTAIDTDAEMTALGALGVNSPTVSAFYVDAINFCGAAIPGIAGCAGVPGNFLVLDSFVASAGGVIFGANAPQNVIGHELGHNLGLNHDETAGNLLTSGLQGGFGNLLAYQVTAILLSPLVQSDALGKFIQIQPYAVVSSVPEPAAYGLFGLGLGLIALLRKRKASAA